MKFSRLIRIIFSFSFMAGIAACSSGGNDNTSDTTIPPFTINSVDLDNGSDLSMTIHLKADSGASNWKLGFYMPFTFKQAAGWNPNLTLQLCAENSPGKYSDCDALNYDENKTPGSYDASAGTTTVFSVDGSSPYWALKPGQQYAIRALHNSLGLARNYSSYPQSFFAIVNDSVINLKPTMPDMYSVSDYNQHQIDAENNQHVLANWTNSADKTPELNIVPSPANFAAGTNGNYALQNGLVIHNVLNPSDNSVANFFGSYLASDKNIIGTIDNSPAQNGILIQAINDASLINNNPEGYQITVSQNAIAIGALTNTGAFYALQSLRQLWMQNSVINGMVIADYPRFKYRGLGIDSARHFVSPDNLKTILDLMAIQKLNTLHLRLADDEGWRLTLNSYPELTTTGANRGYGTKLGSNLIGALLAKQANLDVISGITKPDLYVTPTDIYTGTYDTADIAELIAYANQRQITILPEIDIPGHARALVKSLPAAFFNPDDHSDFASVQGYSDNVLPVCTYQTGTELGKNFTRTMNDIVNQIATIFDNQTTLYAERREISIGADEVNGYAWSSDATCQGNWTSYSALGKGQYFSQLLSEANSTVKFSGWQQLVQNDDITIGANVVAPADTGHIWVWNSAAPGTPQASSLADHEYPTVLAFSDQLYFDLTYNKDNTELGQYWATSYADTQAALSAALSASASESGSSRPMNIAGLEGELWDENIVTFADLIYMATPKMSGLSEAAWSPATVTTQGSKINWQSLATRLGCGNTGFLAMLTELYGVNYRGYPNGIAKEIPNGSVCN